MKLEFYWHDYKYFPYEHQLASKELESLFNRKPRATSRGLSLEVSGAWSPNASRTTYFKEAFTEDGRRVIPLQALLESSANGGAQFELSGALAVPNLHHQSTRYSAHGIHEYRGKFNPQIVRAAGNIVCLRPGDWILDPFCGSGTTLLESMHSGWNAVGIDINPLAIQVAKAKIAALRVSPEYLQDRGEALRKNLICRVGNLDMCKSWSRDEIARVAGGDWQDKVSNPEYVRLWFTEPVLSQVAAILDEVSSIPDTDTKLILQMILSDILRDASLQDPGDLRIRRRKSVAANCPVIPKFLEQMNSQIRRIVFAQRVLPKRESQQSALLGDTRASIVDLLKAHHLKARFDAAITSPPYATALPYIDTQRLSLAILGLVSASDLRRMERTLIGSREITEQEKSDAFEAIISNSDQLPSDCIRLCREMAESVNLKTDGFRRVNMPSLIHRYFRDMASMFVKMRQVLNMDAPYVIVVGRNKTTLGGKEFIIDTPRLLTSLATHSGYWLEDSIELNTYQRYDVHQSNSIRSETMLILRASRNEGPNHSPSKSRTNSSRTSGGCSFQRNGFA